MKANCPCASKIEPLGQQGGFSLIELMISVAIGLVILSAVLYIYVGNRQANRAQELSARMLDSGRFALEIIGRSVRAAGFADLSSAQSSSKTSFTGTPVTGTNGAVGAPDVLTLQRDGAIGDRGCLGTAIAATGNVIQESFNLNAATKELRCDEQIAAAPGAVANGTAIISDVEDFQVLYGLDTTGDESVNQFSAAPGTWSQVISVRVCLQLRSSEVGAVTGSQTFLNCAGALTGAGTTSTINDRRLHRVFMATYNLRNRVISLP
jgi:type IV pilus assembly protein PilW